MHIPLNSRQWAVEKNWLLNMEIGCNVNIVKSFSLTIFESVGKSIFSGMEGKCRNIPTFLKEISQYRRGGFMIKDGVGMGGRMHPHIN